MSSILMDIYPLDVFAIDIPAKLLPLVYDETSFPHLVSEVGKGSAIQAGTDDEVVVFFIMSPKHHPLT